MKALHVQAFIISKLQNMESRQLTPSSSSAYTAALVGSMDETFGRYAGSVSYQI
jgi:hypothetical protein